MKERETTTCFKSEGANYYFARRICPIAVSLMLLVLLCACSSTPDQITKYMDLGEKHLVEMNYEEALVAFEKVIELDPKNFEAYEGIARVYEGWNDYARAAETLRRGMEASVGTNAPSQERKQKMISWYDRLAGEALENGDEETALHCYSLILELDPDNPEASEKIEEYQRRKEIAERSEELSQEIAEYLAGEDNDAIYDLIESEQFQKFTDMMDQLGVEDPIILDTDKGKIGIYRVDSVYGSYMLYYGDYNGEMREGNGVWIGSQGDYYYRAVGSWRADKPNGQQTERFLSVENNAKVEKEVTGNVINGLWDGPVDSGEYDEDIGKVGFIATFTEGRYNTLSYDAESDGWKVSENGYEGDDWDGITHYVHLRGDEIFGIAGFGEEAY